MTGPVDDIEFIASSDHRVGVLAALAGGGCDRDELRSITGASSPTMGRVLSAFEERRWIERDGRTYALTPLGEYVAEQFGELRDALETEQRLREVWRWLPREMDGFSVDLFADAVIAYPGPGYPYEPVERVIDLVEESEWMCGFGATVFKSIANEAICLEVIDGMEFEYVYPPEVLAATVAWDREMVERAAQQDHCTVWVHDDLPDKKRCGFGIFDDRVGICCHDAESRALRAWIDTDAPAARELLRVCKPGGKIGLAGPVPEGWSGDWFAAHAEYAPPPPGVESPLRWGTEDGLEALLGSGVRSIESERRTALQYYRSIDHAVEVFSTYFGPTIQALDKVAPDEQQRLLEELSCVMRRYNRATDGTAIVENQYLQTIATKL